MTYPVSPVAEDAPVTPEVINTWFNKLSTMVVAASNQAAELRRVQEDFAVANQRLDNLALDNAKLKTEVAETWRLVSEMERERDEAKSQLESVKAEAARAEAVSLANYREFEDRLSAVHDAMAGRDQRIAELEHQLADRSQECQDAQGRATEAERKLQGATGDANYWHDRYRLVMEEKVKAQQELTLAHTAKDVLETKLEQVQKTLGEAVALFAPPNFGPQPELPSDAGGYGFGDQDRYPPGRPSDDEIKF